MKQWKQVLCVILSAALWCTAAGCGNGRPERAETIIAGEDSGTVYDTEGGAANFQTEEYRAIEENGYRAVSLHPLSTFSADVDTASYSNVRRLIREGVTVPADAVRIEEMINYFQYQYPQPVDGEPFSITTELSQCPWNPNTKLLLIGLQAKDMDYSELPPSNLVFLLDVSGSMFSDDKLPLVQRAFVMLAENLRPQDRISIVTYAGTDEVVLEGATGEDTVLIKNAIKGLTAGGSTAGSRGIETAYQLAEKNFIEGGNNRVILATDGDLNVGVTSEGELKRLVEKKRETGVFLSVLGFGTGNIRDNKLQTLADNGNGNYAYIDSILEARRVLVEQMGGTLFTVAKDVKLQVEFNPAQLKGYRLIGYEKRLLNSEDFANDKKDAGEIGAGHRVTALYELVEPDSAQEVGGADLKYQKPAEGSGSEWLTVNVRYKTPDSEESRLMFQIVDGALMTETMPDNMDFAAGVAQFGMLLRDSPYKGSSSYSEIYRRLSARADMREDGYKQEFLILLQQLQEQTSDPA